jgi:hypothetical protein
VCVGSMIQWREGEKEKVSIYIQRIIRKTLMLRHSELLTTGYVADIVTLDARKTGLIDLSGGHKARICTVSHMRTRMLHLT